MTSRDFAFWLQGVFDVGGAKQFDEAQTALIRQHLALVFVHEIDPSMGPPEHQEKLDAAHGQQKAGAPPLTAKDVEKLIKSYAPGGPIVMRC